VRAVVVSSRTGPLGTWDVHNARVEAVVQKVELKKGDTLDFVVDPKGQRLTGNPAHSGDWIIDMY